MTSNTYFYELVICRENSGALALTKVGSQRVIQISAVFMLFFSVFDESSSNKNTSLQRNMGYEFSCMIKEAKILASTLGVPCVDSIEEGEAQCALLVSESLTDGCFSSDLDIFLFGARTVYRDICLVLFVCNFYTGCSLWNLYQRELKLAFVKQVVRKTSGSGRVKRVELYGLFIIIDQSKLVGLCHVSEFPEDNVDNLETKYKVHECVKAKVLKIDEERRSSCSFQPM
ncbi:putative XPG/Rad2 endonuclease, XPG-I domain, nucleic acid-binding, RNA-binding domain, S1 [Helianthus annuus]|nr:putative XPG/Rad2 endonuclease, XPG-I domain, nucleic acid-binding, RNA-binding domain, S1 [Helianthus annuus]